jgi:hypothetical protein
VQAAPTRLPPCPPSWRPERRVCWSWVLIESHIHKRGEGEVFDGEREQRAHAPPSAMSIFSLTTLLQLAQGRLYKAGLFARVF